MRAVLFCLLSTVLSTVRGQNQTDFVVDLEGLLKPSSGPTGGVFKVLRILPQTSEQLQYLKELQRNDVDMQVRF